MVSSVINPIYPVEEVRSVEQLMDIAIGVEREAALRYAQLANVVEGRGDHELAATFRELAELERGHERGLAAWAQREGWAEPQAATFAWRFPETFSFDELDGAPLSSYQALGIAVRNEERAFAFYTYLAALADTDRRVQERAEALAREELKHVAQLRRLRRKAFHAAGGARPSPATVVGTVEQLRRFAWGMESASADLAERAAACLRWSGREGAARVLGQAAEASRRRAGDLAPAVPPSDPAEGSRIAAAARTAGLLTEGALTEAGVLGLCERDAQEVLDAYLSIADRAKDERLLHQVQELAEAAMGRLALIRSQVSAG